MPKRFWWMVMTALLLALGAAGANLVQAQNDAPDQAPAQSPAPTAQPAAEGDSLAAAFFISRRVGPAGERSVEVVGSMIIWFLLTLSAVSIGLIGMMAMTNQRKSIAPPGVVEEIRKLLTGGKYREAIELAKEEPSFFSRVMHGALLEANHGFSAVIRSLEQISDELTTRRLRQIEYLNIIGQVSPMIGLFGTVYGMILAFQAIVAAGGDPDPVQLAGGISTALTTTFWGLVVAIPALAGYAIIRNKVDELTTEATLNAEEILNQFRARTAQAGSARKE
ncbi:MAG: MotA/TolQ/ExbB proton channel family protein [Phycisphaerales bacterium]|nr:MAG: MotA/TolQ/ExbB proton channel family protein [Phycisphaerales bacterium]